MAKRVIKKTDTSVKQTAATRRTKKTKTVVKKVPVKKVPVKKVPVKKVPVKKVVKKTLSNKTVKPSKKTVRTVKKKTVVKKTIKTTLAAVARVKLENELRSAEKLEKKQRDKKRGPKREYYIIAETAPIKVFSEMGERVRVGDVKWAYYAIDDSSGVRIGYHHYEKLK